MVEFFYDFDRLTLLRLRALREGDKIITILKSPDKMRRAKRLLGCAVFLSFFLNFNLLPAAKKD